MLNSGSFNGREGSSLTRNENGDESAASAPPPTGLGSGTGLDALSAPFNFPPEMMSAMGFPFSLVPGFFGSQPFLAAGAPPLSAAASAAASALAFRPGELFLSSTGNFHDPLLTLSSAASASLHAQPLFLSPNVPLAGAPSLAAPPLTPPLATEASSFDSKAVKRAKEKYFWLEVVGDACHSDRQQQAQAQAADGVASDARRPSATASVDNDQDSDAGDAGDAAGANPAAANAAVKRKYRRMRCLVCARFNPLTPWATLKARKFEHDSFRDHEGSIHHQRAIDEKRMREANPLFPFAQPLGAGGGGTGGAADGAAAARTKAARGSGAPAAAAASSPMATAAPPSAMDLYSAAAAATMMSMNSWLYASCDPYLTASAAMTSASPSRSSSTATATATAATAARRCPRRRHRGSSDQRRQRGGAGGGGRRWAAGDPLTSAAAGRWRRGRRADDGRRQRRRRRVDVEAGAPPRVPTAAIVALARAGAALAAEQPPSRAATRAPRSAGDAAASTHALNKQRMIVLPDWLLSRGKLRHSENYLARQLSQPPAAAAHCAEFQPGTPWASWRPRKFEVSVFALHENSVIHRRAVAMHLAAQRQQPQPPPPATTSSSAKAHATASPATSRAALSTPASLGGSGGLGSAPATGRLAAPRVSHSLSHSGRLSGAGLSGGGILATTSLT
eukprot:gene8284-5975_t